MSGLWSIGMMVSGPGSGVQGPNAVAWCCTLFDHDLRLPETDGTFLRLQERPSSVRSCTKSYDQTWSPGFTIDTYREEVVYWQVTKDLVERSASALRRAGLAESN